MTSEPATAEPTELAEGVNMEVDHKHRRKLPECANCGFSFGAEPKDADNFCPRCGQENHELNVPFKHLVLEFLEGTLHFDSKFFRSMQFLLLRPGHLTHEFNIGRRAGYVPPVRLYVFTSFLFFLLLSWHLSTVQNNPITTIETTAAPVAINHSDTVSKPVTRRATVTFGEKQQPVSISMDAETRTLIEQLKTPEQIDSFLIASGETPGFISRVALKQASRLSNQGHEKFMSKMIKNTSILMFFLMPLFGLLIGLAYRKHKRHYVEFLMFSLHFHTFLFVLFGLYLLVPARVDSLILDSLVFLLPALYLGIALKRVFPQSLKWVTLKTLMLYNVYALLLSALLLATILVSFAFF